MSFSTQVKDELNSIQIKGNCCKKAYLLGALMPCEQAEDGIILRLSDEGTADKLKYILGSLYKCTPEEKKIKRGCFEATEFSFKNKKIEDFLSFANEYTKAQDANRIFKCSNCRSAFLRGVFCSCGTLSDPKKSFSLELRVKDRGRAQFIQSVVDTWGIDHPLITQRGEIGSLFYRKESAIGDFLSACGSTGTVFLFYDIMVEKDVRNEENRATNCVTRNIGKSVLASSLQIHAIEALTESRIIEDLPAELIQTAELRMSYPDMTLSELAALHEPPISKSGLNHRLSRLIEEARRRKLIR